MKQGYRLEGQIGNERQMRTTKNLLEYTPGNILDKGNNWLSDKAPNAEMLTRKGDEFDKLLKIKKMVMTIAVPEIQMRIMPYKEKDYFESYQIIWYNTSNSNVWRRIVFHHITVGRVTLRDFSKAIEPIRPHLQQNINYYEVVMKIDANIDYWDS